MGRCICLAFGFVSVRARRQAPALVGAAALQRRFAPVLRARRASDGGDVRPGLQGTAWVYRAEGAAGRVGVVVAALAVQRPLSSELQTFRATMSALPRRTDHFQSKH